MTTKYMNMSNTYLQGKLLDEAILSYLEKLKLQSRALSDPDSLTTAEWQILGLMEKESEKKKKAQEAKKKSYSQKQW